MSDNPLSNFLLSVGQRPKIHGRLIAYQTVMQVACCRKFPVGLQPDQYFAPA